MVGRIRQCGPGKPCSRDSAYTLSAGFDLEIAHRDGAMLLWQQGKIDLDAPVQKYCPAFPQKDTPITTRELLGHLGGIRHYKTDGQDDPEGGNTKHFLNPIQAGLDFFKSDPLVAKPGTEFHYSTQGFTLVGCAIEGASERIVCGLRPQECAERLPG
jgi:CubicO group peptidase (beta-lactamase class C family)